jgi:serralysin
VGSRSDLEEGAVSGQSPVDSPAPPAPGPGDGAPRPVPVLTPEPVTVNLAALRGLDVASLLEGHRWQSAPGADGRTVITYSFTAPGSVFASSDAFATSVQAMGANDRAVVRNVLATIEAVAAVRFVEVPDNGVDGSTLRYGYSQRPNEMGFAGYTFFPSASAQAGDIWLGRDQAGGMWDFYRPDLVLHETLHALGLKHPFEGTRVLAVADDILPNTVMSYSALAGLGDGSLSSYPVEPMPIDIQALQALYGAAEREAGNTTYRLDAASWRQGFHVIWDTGGADVLDARGLGTGVSLDLVAGARSDIGSVVYAVGTRRDGTVVSGAYHQTLAIAQGVVVEHAVGTAFGDLLQGNAAGNALVGGLGDDRLLGLGGDDWLAGGEGSDRLDGGTGIDTAYFDRSVMAYDFSSDAQYIYVRDLLTGSVDTLSNMERAVFADFTFSPGGLPVPVALVGVPDFAG